MHTLITIRISHYNEKARWALDRLGVPYRERAFMPMFHMPVVALATWRSSDAASDAVSTRFSTPVLVTADGRRICDSSRIAQWASDTFSSRGADLYPDPECAQLEARFHDRLGPHTRRLAYFYSLDDAALARSLARANVGAVQAALFAAFLPLGWRALARALGVNPARAADSRARVREEMAWASERLGGRRYLVGDRFTAADMALASMAAPALLIGQDEGYGAVMPARERVPAGARELAEELRATPAGEHVLRMFREERARPGAAR